MWRLRRLHWGGMIRFAQRQAARMSERTGQCLKIVLHSEAQQPNANTLKLLKVDSSPAGLRILKVQADAIGAAHG